MLSLVINNGFVVDPKNRLYSHLNVGLEDGLVKCISPEKLEGAREIDARGLIVCPGFVDCHMHEDSYIQGEGFENQIFPAMLRMGVTTAIGGNCGAGPEEITDYIYAINNSGIPLNLGMLLPHNVLRKKLGPIDKYQELSREELDKMKELGEDLIDDFLGLSFGIRYIPGINERELRELASICRKDQKLVAAHVRDDASNIVASIDELLEVGRELELPLQVSHLGSMAAYGQMEEVLSILDGARSQGMKIGIDCYPYKAFSTSIGATTYDPGFLERYRIDYSAIEIGSGPYAGRRCDRELFDQLRQEAGSTLTIGHVMDEAQVDMALVHPQVAMASDGILEGGQGHPRAAGSFPRFIRQYVKEKKLLSLNEAIRKITVLPSEFMSIDRGSLSIGSPGDVVIFDLDTIRDRASFQDPLGEPEGIKYVIVNGELALEDGQIIRDDLGKYIRKKVGD